MNYALTLPIAGIICFGFGFLFGQPALRLSGVYLALATFALATAMPQLLKLGYFEHWTGGVQGLVVTKPDAPFGLPMSQDMWLYYFTLVITIAIYIVSVNLLRSRSGPRLHGDPRQRDRGLRDGRRRRAVQDAGVRRAAGITGVAGGLGAIAVQSWRRTATPSCSRSSCSSAWSSAASDGCPDRSSARPSSSSCRTSGGNFEGTFRRGIRRATVPRHLPRAARRKAGRHRCPATDRQTQEKLKHRRDYAF